MKRTLPASAFSADYSDPSVVRQGYIALLNHCSRCPVRIDSEAEVVSYQKLLMERFGWGLERLVELRNQSCDSTRVSKRANRGLAPKREPKFPTAPRLTTGTAMDYAFTAALTAKLQTA